jgi:eukaryotic-like serine/threonine-protein kinase
MPCPSTEAIESFLSGDGACADRPELEQHFSDCELCRDLLCRLSAPSPLPLDGVPSKSWPKDVAERLAKRLHEEMAHRPDEAGLRLPFSIGKYELLEVIGHGGMGTVYRARQLELDRPVAIKMIVRQFLKPSLVERFFAEARSGALLDHPGIVPVYDVGRFGSHVYFAMALVSGGTLAERLARAPVEVRHAAELLRDIALAVHFAHARGVIHRDLKPSNILLDGEGRPKIADFGLAKQIESGTDLTATGEILGTPGYMSPEQAGGPGGITIASDVYGLGAILYHLLTGKAPFAGDEVGRVLYRVVHEPPCSEFPPDVSRDLRTITLKCLSKQPAERYESAAAVARELDRYLRGEPIEARPPSRVGRAVRWCRRHPALAAMSTAALVAVIAGTAFSVYFGLLAQGRSVRLASANQQLQRAEREARRTANDAAAHAAVATEQANAAMQTLELTLYELQPVVTDDPAAQRQRKDLLSSVLQGLEGLNEEYISPPRLQRCRAHTILGLADVVRQLGNDSGQTGVAASRDLYRQAVEQFQTLRDSDPESVVAAGDLGNALKEFADTLAEAGEWREANRYFQQALPLCERLAAEFPDDPGIQSELAELEVFCGEGLTHTGSREPGGEMLRRARDRCVELVEHFPDDRRVRGALFYASQELGDWHMLGNDVDAAYECFMQMKSAAARVVERFPGDARALLDESTSLERLGDVSLARGDRQLSLDQHLESLKIAEAAGRIAPDNDDLQWHVSFGHQKVADAYLRVGNPAAARDAALNCVEIRRRLAAADPKNANLHAKLFHALGTLTRCYELERDFALALKWHEEILKFATNYNDTTNTTRFAPQIEKAQTAIDRCQKILSEDTATSDP